MNFHYKIVNMTKRLGFKADRAYPFVGKVKYVKAGHDKKYFTFKQGDDTILVKTVEQSVGGSASDKIPAFYINLQKTPYTKTFIVVDTDNVVTFAPWLNYFKGMESSVHIMTNHAFTKYLKEGNEPSTINL